MNPFNPPDFLILLSHHVWERTGVIIPPFCWSLAAGALFLIGLLCVSVGIRTWLNIPD